MSDDLDLRELASYVWQDAPDADFDTVLGNLQRWVNDRIESDKARIEQDREQLSGRLFVAQGHEIRANNAEAEVERLRAERDLLAQAMWDARAELGFDNDGDKTPHAAIHGDYQRFAGLHVLDAREARDDYEAALDESTVIERDARRLRAGITALAEECASSGCIHMNTLWGRLKALLAPEPTTRTHDAPPFNPDPEIIGNKEGNKRIQREDQAAARAIQEAEGR